MNRHFANKVIHWEKAQQLSQWGKANEKHNETHSTPARTVLHRQALTSGSRAKRKRWNSHTLLWGGAGVTTLQNRLAAALKVTREVTT